jgi:hypothetical protein
MNRACRAQPSQIATIIVDDGSRAAAPIIHLMDGRRKQVLLLASELKLRTRGGCRLRG